MNIHLSQSIPAIAETKNIISTVENFNSSQDSKPMIGFKLDAMTSAYLITLGTIPIPRWLFYDILSKLDSERVKHKLNHIKEVLTWKTELSTLFNQLIQTNPDLQALESNIDTLQQEYDLAQEKYKTAKGKDIASMYKQIEKQKKELQSLQRQKNTILETYQSSMLEELLYTGHNLISVLLPDDFEYEIQNNASPDKKPVHIIRGVLLSGTLDKKAMGSSSGSLIHHLSKDYNNQRALRFVSEFSRMMNAWLYQQGFTVGIYDCIAHNTEVIEEEINKNLLKAKASIQSEKDPELREMNIKIALNDTASIARKIAADALTSDNNIKKIVKSGSKGNDFNITQITGLVGQQNVSGNRIEKQFGGRTLPHFEFEIDDIRTEFMSRGFIFSSYFKGMNPLETFFAAAGGREGLIDTAVKTADTGYISRRMEKILEDLTASYVGTVNDASHNIIQFNYGEDNFDAGKCIFIGSKGGKQIYSFIDLKHVVTKYNTGLEWKQRKTGVANKKRKFTQDEIQKIKEEIIRGTYTSFFHKHTTEEVVKNCFSTLEPAIYQVEVYPEVIQDIYKEITRQLKLAIVNPGESVGHIAASSMGEKNTQLTLNSVVGETQILVLIQGKAVQTTIGELIHSIGEKKGFTIVKYEGQNDTLKEATAEIVNVNELDWKIQSVDEDGHVDWRQITKCIRHPLYTDVIKVKTESGRDVTATTGLSFLVKDKHTGKIVPIKGSELKIGDRIPIGYKSPRVINTFINLREFFCPTQYIYGNELWKAREYRDKYSSKELVSPSDFKKDGKNAKWWSIHQNTDFILPFTRSDHAMRTLEGYNGINRGSEFYKKDCIYIKGQTVSEAHIPENIELDELFGFFVGIYLAEGCCSDNYVSISNYDINVLNKVQSLCEKWNIGWHHVQIGYKYKYMNKYEELKGRSVSDKAKELESSDNPCEIRIHSKLISTMMEKTCGKGSANKHIPYFAYTAPDSFIKGMLDAMYSGDGTIHETSIDYISISERLIDGLITILSSIGITGSKHTYLPKSNNKNSKNIQRVYSVNILQRNNKRFTEFVDTLTIKYKSDKIQSFKTRKYTHDVYWSKKTKIKDEDTYVNQDEDVFMDAIVSIEKVDTTNIEYVYDFEVPSTGNFNILNQMHVRDSFHSSGQLKKNLTYGVVRLQELMNATHNPKTRSLTVYFNKSKVNVTDLATVRQLTNMFLLSHTLSDFITSYKIERQPELTKSEQIWYYAYKTFVANDDTSSCSYRLRLHINRDLLFLTKRTLRQICKQIEMIYIKNVNFYVVCSTDSIGIIDIWVEENISEPSTFFNAKGMEDDLLLDNFINKHNKMSHLIKKIILPKLQKCHISGIEGITECYYDVTPTEEWYITTRGGSLKCLLFNSLFDHNRCSTNDMWEIYELFGVECAKKWLKDEFGQMLDVNHRHLDVLVDKVTFNGSISSVNIYGLDRKVIGPLSKAVFERPLASLLAASQKAELDRLSSIGACIATGKVGRFGTGMVDLILDNQSVITNEYANKIYTTEDTDTSELAPLTEEEEGLTVEEAIDLNEEDIY